jgi:YVTN family beta-propeller protein
VLGVAHLLSRKIACLLLVSATLVAACGQSLPRTVQQSAAPTAPAASSENNAVADTPATQSPPPVAPLSGEYVVTANEADRTLSVVPVGLAKVAMTIPLDIVPRGVVAGPHSARVVASDASSHSHTLALADLNARAEVSTLDVGSRPDHVVAPPLDQPGPMLVVSDADDSTRSVDATLQATGEALKLGAGPHAVATATDTLGVTTNAYVSNAGDGTVSIIDMNATSIRANLAVGGRPIGVAAVPQGDLWLADGDTGTLTEIDPGSDKVQQTVQVGPHLTGLAATPDGHYVLASSGDPDHALYSIDLYAQQLGQHDQVVRSLAVSGGVLALATGVEVSIAYATTSDNQLIYWDLVSNTVEHSVQVGQKPVALALSLTAPTGILSAAARVGGGTVSSGASAGGAGGSASSTTSSGSNPAGASAKATSAPSASTGAGANAPAAAAGGATTSASGANGTTGAGVTSTTGGTTAAAVASNTGPGSTTTGNQTAGAASGSGFTVSCSGCTAAGGAASGGGSSSPGASVSSGNTGTSQTQTAGGAAPSIGNSNSSTTTTSNPGANNVTGSTITNTNTNNTTTSGVSTGTTSGGTTGGGATAPKTTTAGNTVTSPTSVPTPAPTARKGQTTPIATTAAPATSTPIARPNH